MADIPSQGPLVQAKLMPDIYCVVLLIAIVALILTLVIVTSNLLAPVFRADGTAGGYGLSFGDLFGPLKELTSAK